MKKLKGYYLEHISEEQFSSFEDDWHECLECSSSDPIFSSWAWCYAWWKTWSKKHDFKLFILAVYYEGNIVGIAPLYLTLVKRRFGPFGYQAQILGTSWRIISTVRTEFTSFIIRKDHENDVLRLIGEHLEKENIQDFIAQDHSSYFKEYFHLVNARTITQRSVDRGANINVTGDFRKWVESLGKNTRLKVFNRRNYLGDRVKVVRTSKLDSREFQGFFDMLCDFHRDRRQTQPEQYEIEFHNHFLNCSGKYIKPVYSYMYVDDKVMSLVYDVTSECRRYNLQSVFAAEFDKKVSLGLLHLGYEIEDAFTEEETLVYDLLAGEGKNTFYKERLLGDFGTIYELETNQLSLTRSHSIYINIHMLARKLMARFRTDNSV